MKNVIAVVVSVVLFCSISLSVFCGFVLDKDSGVSNSKAAASSANSSTETMANVLDNPDNALTLRLTQLLNLNRIFDDCIYDSASLVDEASVVLLQDAETDENMDTIISQASILSFIYDMYGVTVDISSLPAEYTDNVPDGYFYVIPRGYDTFSQTITGLSVGDDGKITVTSKLMMNTHEGDVGTGTVTTVFVANSASAFGYNIVSSAVTSFSYTDDSTQAAGGSSLDLTGDFETLCY